MTRMILVDTSVLIDFFQGLDSRSARFFELQIKNNPELIAIPDFCLFEIISGLRSEKSIREAIAALTQYVIVSPTGPELMIKAALHYRFLRRKGITVRSMIDCLIAALALENDWPLLHHDRDFIAFEKHLGLKNPL